MDFDLTHRQSKAIDFVGQKFLYVFALVTLKLNHLTHFIADDDGAIAGEFLLDDLENLLLIELLGYSLDGGQGLPAIPLLDADMDVFLRLLGLTFFIGLREGVEGSEVFNLRHKLVWLVLDGVE